MKNFSFRSLCIKLCLEGKMNYLSSKYKAIRYLIESYKYNTQYKYGFYIKRPKSYESTLITNYPDNWIKRYIYSAYFIHDFPIVSESINAHIEWGIDKINFKGLRKIQKQILIEATGFNIFNGISFQKKYRDDKLILTIADSHTSGAETDFYLLKYGIEICKQLFPIILKIYSADSSEAIQKILEQSIKRKTPQCGWFVIEGEIYKFTDYL